MTPRQKEYQLFLESDWWKMFRVRALSYYAGHCSKCLSKQQIHVHHIRYPYPWTKTTLQDVVLLCYKCHDWVHKDQSHILSGLTTKQWHFIQKQKDKKTRKRIKNRMQKMLKRLNKKRSENYQHHQLTHNRKAQDQWPRDKWHPDIHY